MITRLLLGIASLLGLALATAAPAGATTTDDHVTLPYSTWSCVAEAADGGPSWYPLFDITGDRGDGVYDVAYALVPDVRSLFRMPIGTGVVEAVSFEEWGGDGELLAQAGPTDVPEEERTPCSEPYPKPLTIDSEVRFLVPPVKPTFTEIEAFCAASADDPTIDTNDEYDVASCTTMLTGMVRPEVK